MTEIFISYRDDDGNTADGLAQALEDEFATFIDVHLKGGADLRKEIMAALAEARVVVVFIGPEWVKPANLQRLKNDKDWIRQELALAFARGVSVLPVLADVTMPAEADLPADLQRLSGILGLPLRSRSRETDKAAILTRVRELLLDKPPTPAVSTSAGMPAALPYLCDRSDQEDDLTDLVKTVQEAKSLFCVVHGHMWEAHSGFLSRLRQRRALEDLFASVGISVEEFPLDWNPSLAKAGKHGEALRTAIKKSAAMNERKAEDEKLYAYLRNPGQPTVLTMQVTADDFQECGDGLLAAFEQAWTELMQALGRAPTHFLALWLNVTYESAPNNWSAGLRVPPLQELNPVRQAHVLSWMDQPEVSPFIARHRTAVTNLLTDPSVYLKPGQIRMQRFVDAVCALIPGP